MSRPRGTGSIYQYKGCSVWYVKYYKANGVAVRESSHSDKRKVAENLLKTRLAEIQTGNYIEPTNRKLTVDDLYASLLADYRANELASVEGAEQRWQVRLKGENGEVKLEPGRLQQTFGGLRAINVTTDMLNKYVASCREEGLSNATINRDLSALRRAFKLAVKAGQMQKAPNFPHLKEAAPRSGFVEQADYDKLKSKARPLWLRGMLATAYAFGFRKSELLNLRVKQVDLLNRSIRLNAGETKSGDGRVVKLTQDVFILLQACGAGKDADAFVFTRENGKPIEDFRGAWEKLCSDAGIPGLLFHDLRRSAVRNMVRRGVPEVVAMKISGHKTRSVFDRYNIVSESDLDEAARKIEAGQKIPTPAVCAENGQKQAEMHQSGAVQELRPDLPN